MSSLFWRRSWFSFRSYGFSSYWGPQLFSNNTSCMCMRVSVTHWETEQILSDRKRELEERQTSQWKRKNEATSEEKEKPIAMDSLHEVHFFKKLNQSGYLVEFFSLSLTGRQFIFFLPSFFQAFFSLVHLLSTQYKVYQTLLMTSYINRSMEDERRKKLWTYRESFFFVNIRHVQSRFLQTFEFIIFFYQILFFPIIFCTLYSLLRFFMRVIFPVLDKILSSLLFLLRIKFKLVRKNLLSIRWFARICSMAKNACKIRFTSKTLRNLLLSLLIFFFASYVRLVA